MRSPLPIIGLVLAAGCGQRSGAPKEPASEATVTVSVQPPENQTVGTVLVGYQDGDGPWQLAHGVDGVYGIPITSPRYGVVTTCPQSDFGMVSLYHYTVAEMPRLELSELCGDTTLVDLTGRVSGIDGVGARVITSFHDRPVDLDGRYELYATLGVQDLVAYAIAGDDQDQWTTRMRIFRDLRLDGDTSLDIDLAVDSFVPEAHTVTVEGVGPDEPVTVRSFFNSSRGAHPVLSMDRVPPYQVQLVPEKTLRDGDLHRTDARTDDAGGWRWASAGAADPVFRFGPPLDDVLVDVAGGTHVRVSWAPYPDANGYALDASSDYHMGDPDDHEFWSVYLSAAWVAGTTESGYVFPDLAALTAWPASLDLLRSGEPILWSVDVSAGPAAASTTHGARRHGRVPGGPSPRNPSGSPDDTSEESLLRIKAAR